MAWKDKLKNDKGEMTFLGHLDALRWHLMRSFMVVMGCAISAFFFKHFLFDVILFGPRQPS